MSTEKAISDRVERMEDELYRTHPENPGAIIRLDRAERVLHAMLWVGGIGGGLGVFWKALDVIGAIVRAKVGP